MVRRAVAIVATVILCAVLYAFFNYTRMGTAMRATVQQTVAAFAAFLEDELALKGVVFDDTVFGAPGSNLRLTLAEAAERSRLQEQFTQDALAAERDMLATGLGYPLEDVRRYFTQMAEFRAGRAERPVRPAPKKLL